MPRILTLLLAAVTLSACAPYEPEPVSPWQWQQRQGMTAIGGSAIGG